MLILTEKELLAIIICHLTLIVTLVHQIIIVGIDARPNHIISLLVMISTILDGCQLALRSTTQRVSCIQNLTKVSALMIIERQVEIATTTTSR